MRADAPVKHFAFLVGVARAGQAAQQREAAAALDLLEDGVELFAQPREREEVRRERYPRAGSPCMDKRGVDFRRVARVQAVDPGSVVLKLRPDPGAGVGNALARNGAT
jgi:hypothetical protein